MYTTEYFIKRTKAKHGDRYDYSESVYTNYGCIVKIGCKTHGIFEQNANEHIRRTGCPLCKVSTGEERVRKFLEDNKIKFKREHCFPKSRLRFDFYLKDMNILIEFDGPQHFRPVKFYGGEKGFKRQQKRDKIKNLLARKYKINLVRIMYTQLPVIEGYIKSRLKRLIKYEKDGKYYKSFLGLSQSGNIPSDATLEDCKEFLYK